MATFSEDIRVNGNVSADSISSTTGSITDAMCHANMSLSRSKIGQESIAPYSIALHDWRTWNAITSSLPAAAAADDLGYDGGTFGTEAPHITAGDLKAAGATTRYARTLFHLPAEYDDGETVYIRLHAGMLTTIADVSCTVDVQCYESNESTGVSADLCTTVATTCNSLTFADVDFVLTSTALISGDTLDIRISVICNDAATGTVVEPVIGATQLLCDIRG